MIILMAATGLLARKTACGALAGGGRRPEQQWRYVVGKTDSRPRSTAMIEYYVHVPQLCRNTPLPRHLHKLHGTSGGRRKVLSQRLGKELGETRS